MDNFDILSTILNIGTGLVLGVIISLFYMYKSTYNKQFVITLAMLPAIVGVVISVVNGNIGTGIAVMGAFSLVRFRSIPGSAKEIAFILFSMAVGLGTGMGYLLYSSLFVLIVGSFSLLLYKLNFGEQKQNLKHLKITIPENLSYSDLFDDLFMKYTSSFKLKSVKTTNMGSLFQLRYEIVLKDEHHEKEFLDKIRCRNGNLEIVCGQLSQTSDVL